MGLKVVLQGFLPPRVGDIWRNPLTGFLTVSPPSGGRQAPALPTVWRTHPRPRTSCRRFPPRGKCPCTNTGTHVPGRSGKSMSISPALDTAGSRIPCRSPSERGLRNHRTTLLVSPRTSLTQSTPGWCAVHHKAIDDCFRRRAGGRVATRPNLFDAG